MQLKQQNVKPKGRRFTYEDKLFALTLFKNSPKGYRLLCNFFALPTPRTLNSLLRMVSLESGINKVLFDSLKEHVLKMNSLDRYCTVIFDEVALEPALVYLKKKDYFIGFQDNGANERLPLFADKAMVFMARGIHKKWKQPLCYFFNAGGMKSDVLANCIKLVITECKSIGLKVIGTVCDQGSANIKAINLLYEETKNIDVERSNYFGFLVDGEEVVPFYDPPHLLKGIRNNLFTYNCRFKWRNNKIETASWTDIRTLYELEEKEEDYKMCTKLTDIHVHNKKKMKVSIAAQVFSQRVASLMRGLARLGPQHMPPSGLETAELLLFMDKAFDSLNGGAIFNKSGKELQRAVSDTTKHEEFWKEAIEVFNSMEFFNDKRKRILPPSIKNWCHTLKAFLYIWPKLKNDGFKFLCSRNINQDPLENFFGRIRSHGSRNVYPTCYSFVASFKTIMLGSIVSLSQNCNCEEDGTVMLHNLKKLIIREHIQYPIPLENLIEGITVPNTINYSLVKNGTLTYIAGYIGKRILKLVKGCDKCKADLIGDLTDLNSEDKFVIRSRSFRINSLLAPTTNFSKIFKKCIYILENTVPRICHKNNIGSILKFIILTNINSLLNCTQHDTLDMVISFIVDFHLNTWTKRVNKILKGKIQCTSSSDPIKILARKQFLKHKSFSLKMRNT
ncbi:uncharacterized protein LOC115884077 [Sitophilus oryzae]|uniref:Uncharacterized protein LOC115884077 n=1 Tax=Sitophilus oryzae TaxID=7048 RepID=A0A6J2Y3K8_SITOR|nr:uncharacterized protein LOC115884077 [Sitophilus oryzae]XP_030758399.1 uncharacterized protein LOC115884077 [Sitophilus oryzae]